MLISWRSSLGYIATLGLLLLVACNDGSDAHIRLLNVSQGYSSLDLYSDSSEVVTATATNNVSKYAGIKAASHTISITSDGVSRSNALQSTSESFSKNKHKTYVAYGDSGSFATLEISEDQDAPSSGYAKVEVLNTAVNAGSVDVYLTSSSVALTDTSATFSSTAAGKATAFSSITSGTFRLRVTAAGSKSDLRLDIPSLTLNSGSITSIIITDTSGGFLVDGVVLPQQGSAIVESNPYARVRAVAGVTSGSQVTASIAGVALVAAAPANSIGSYQLVDVGTDDVTLSVSGTSVTVANQTLTEGADYTFLVWSGSGGTQTALITDNNHLPASGYANIRLVNVMSGLADPISLAVDYSPAASSIALGSASSYATVASSTTAELSVTDASTSAALFSQSSTTLNSEEVYTVFMFGSAASPTGSLRADR